MTGASQDFRDGAASGAKTVANRYRAIERFGVAITSSTVDSLAAQVAYEMGGAAIPDLEPAADEPQVEWWILDGGFFVNNGREYSGPYRTQEDAFCARRTIEDILAKTSGHTYFIDKRVVSS